MTDPVDSERLLSPDQVAEWLNERGMAICARSVRRAIKAKQMPGYQIGSRFITPLPLLERWLRGPLESTDKEDAPRPLLIPFFGRKAS